MAFEDRLIFRVAPAAEWGGMGWVNAEEANLHFVILSHPGNGKSRIVSIRANKLVQFSKLIRGEQVKIEILF
jgi:hypothetical protein